MKRHTLNRIALIAGLSAILTVAALGMTGASAAGPVGPGQPASLKAADLFRATPPSHVIMANTEGD